MSFEKKIGDKQALAGDSLEKIRLSILKYFWQLSPLLGKEERVIPKFLRNREFLKKFSDNELRVLSQYFHRRQFVDQEVVFNQGDMGVGLYFIFSGGVDILAKPLGGGRALRYVTSLEQGDVFGELALLEEDPVRTATVVAKNDCTLLGIFKPDLEDLIEHHPSVGAKFLHGVSVVIAGRLSSIASEMKVLKSKLLKLEKGERGE